MDEELIKQVVELRKFFEDELHRQLRELEKQIAEIPLAMERLGNELRKEQVGAIAELRRETYDNFLQRSEYQYLQDASGLISDRVSVLEQDKISIPASLAAVDARHASEIEILKVQNQQQAKEMIVLHTEISKLRSVAYRIVPWLALAVSFASTAFYIALHIKIIP